MTARYDAAHLRGRCKSATATDVALRLARRTEHADTAPHERDTVLTLFTKPLGD